MRCGDMVSHVPNYQSLDGVFHALADPTRRAVVAQLSRGPAAVSDLAQPFDMALPTFLQHLQVLEAAGLVRSRKTGRVRTCRLAPRPLKTAEHWLQSQRNFWDRRLDQLDALLIQLKENPE